MQAWSLTAQPWSLTSPLKQLSVRSGKYVGIVGALWQRDAPCFR